MFLGGGQDYPRLKRGSAEEAARLKRAPRSTQAVGDHTPIDGKKTCGAHSCRKLRPFWSEGQGVPLVHRCGLRGRRGKIPFRIEAGELKSVGG